LERCQVCCPKVYEEVVGHDSFGYDLAGSDASLKGQPFRLPGNNIRNLLIDFGEKVGTMTYFRTGLPLLDVLVVVASAGSVVVTFPAWITAPDAPGGFNS
jgi:hypothetical protein